MFNKIKNNLINLELNYSTIIKLFIFTLIMFSLLMLIYFWSNELKKFDETYYKEIQQNKQEYIENKNYSWIEVGNTSINYPVLQGENNNYYLYRDKDGNYSYTTVFMDYRNRPKDLNKIIYGHALINNGMFTPISKCFIQNDFNQIGEIIYYDNEGNKNIYTPLCGLDVENYYQKIQKFVFDPDQEQIDLEFKKYEDSFITKKSSDRIYNNLKMNNYHEWLKELVSDSKAINDNYEEIINNSTNSITLVTCAYPFHETRSILIGVSSN